jgi:hypothetical protein
MPGAVKRWPDSEVGTIRDTVWAKVRERDIQSNPGDACMLISLKRV